jgi:hypothetical protein
LIAYPIISRYGQVFAKPDTFILQVAAEEKTKTTEEGFAAVQLK